jgi:hypothetical protein
MNTPPLRGPASKKKIAGILQGVFEIVLDKMKAPPAESSFDYYIIQKRIICPPFRNAATATLTIIRKSSTRTGRRKYPYPIYPGWKRLSEGEQHV